jgi:hypothetical protein
MRYFAGRLSLNRYDAEKGFDDTLGHAIRWSLRGSVANAAPSDEVWARIKQRVCADEDVAAGEAHKFFVHSRSKAEIIKLARLRQAAGRMHRLCAAAWRVLDEHTLSSEVMWGPETAKGARYRSAPHCVISWPMCGQMLPIF